MPTELHIGVMGAGAVGCYVGGALAARGERVTFIGRDRVRADTALHGISVVTLGGKRMQAAPGRVHFETNASALRECDVVLCCVKSQHTEATARELVSVVKPGALVVSLQNGVRNAAVIRQAMPGVTVLGAVVGFNVVDKGSGVFAQTTGGGLIIESSDDARLKTLVDALQESGVGTRVSTDVHSHQWSKLIVNLNNAVSALSGVPTRQLIQSSGYRSIISDVMREALQVLSNAGVKTGAPMRVVPRALQLPSWVFSLAASRVSPDARASMWEDLHRRRPTEVDFLNGEIVRLATENGSTAPLNAKLVELVHDAEKRGAGSPNLDAETLRTALRA